jgi:hypothetical protein
MTKKEACALLGISPRTLDRRMAKGVYKFTRTGEGQFAELSFTHADIGLTEPTPVPVTAEIKPVHDVQIRPEYNDEPTERSFAERYLANEVPDSSGNYHDGSNPRWPNKGLQSLLGPIEPMPRVRPDTTAHMNPALVGDISTAPNPVDSEEFMELLNPGHTDRIAAMYTAAGTRQPSEQQRKQAVDVRTIAAAFRQGYSR